MRLSDCWCSSRRGAPRLACKNRLSNEQLLLAARQCIMVDARRAQRGRECLCASGEDAAAELHALGRINWFQTSDGALYNPQERKQ